VKKVIELIRVSTQAQAGDDRASIPSQKSANRRTAEIYGLSITKSIELTDVSGTAVLRAPEMQNLLRLFDWRFMNRENKRRILAVTIPEIRVSNYQVRGISVSSPSFCGGDVTRSRAASLIATPNPERIYLPLNL
jgi:hypothetical protein